MSYQAFPARAPAERLAQALNATHGPPLPRCDSPRWGGDDVQQGPARYHPTCTCPSRIEPEPGCVYATWAHAAVMERPNGEFIVVLDTYALAQGGRSVSVGGQSYEIPSGAGVDIAFGLDEHPVTVWPPEVVR